MYSKFKKPIVIILTLIILMSGPSSLATAETVASLNVGDYIQFGSYFGEPILWRVINKNDDDSVLLFSERILCLKPFDAAESGKYNSAGGSYTSDIERQKTGSNNWENSNLREWLNSADQTVQYTTQPPKKTTLVYGNNRSEYEPGFLNNFTQDEIDAIQPVTHKSILASVDSSMKDGGTQVLDYEYDLSDPVENYDTAYYKNVTDKVFLLDEKEIREYVFNRGYECKRIPTEKAAIYADETQDTYLMHGNEWPYWLRSPEAKFSQLVRHVYSDGYVYVHIADYMDGGVTPALNLKSTVSISGGNGTLAAPYTFPHTGSASMTPNRSGEALNPITLNIPYDLSITKLPIDAGHPYGGVGIHFRIDYNINNQTILINNENGQNYRIDVERKVGENGAWGLVGGNAANKFSEGHGYNPPNLYEATDTWEKDYSDNAVSYRVRMINCDASSVNEEKLWSDIATFGSEPSIKATSWAIPEIEKAIGDDLVPYSIMSDFTKPITRKEFAELAVSLYEKYTGIYAVTSPGGTFTDCEDTEVLKANNLGIVKGVGNGEFDPDALINREQIAAMLYRTIKVMLPGVGMPTTGESSFKDEKSISPDFLQNVKFMSKNGFIVGSNGYFAPKDTCTCEMAVLIVVRVYECYKNK